MTQQTISLSPRGHICAALLLLTARSLTSGGGWRIVVVRIALANVEGRDRRRHIVVHADKVDR